MQRQANNPDKCSVKTLTAYMKNMRRICVDLYHEYLIKYIGMDSYGYLMFQRRLLWAFVTYYLISILTHTIFYLGLSSHGDSRMSLDELIKSSKFRALGSAYTTFQVFIFTALVIKALLDIRVNTQATFYYNYEIMNEERGLGWLKLRTLLMKTNDFGDSDGSNLMEKIHRQFRENGVRGNALGIVTIPDYTKLVKIEKDKKKLKQFYALVTAKPPTLCKCMLTKDMMDEEEYNKSMRKYDRKIDKLLDAPLKFSGVSFVCFDSLKTVNEVLNIYNSGTIMSDINIHAEKLGITHHEKDNEE